MTLKNKKILVTGGAGFIGSLLTGELIKKGYKVKIFERFDFGIEPIKELTYHKNLKIYFGDIRNTKDIEKSLAEVDTVIHLASIVGDPACSIHADRAIDINIKSTSRLVSLVKKRGIKRFIFASTCSVYGANTNKNLRETDELNPVSLYALTKWDAEKTIFSIEDDNFQPTVLRFGTLYGLSDRMRFDLVINYLTQKLLLEKEGKIFGGEQWRPFVHVKDTVKGIILALESPIEKVGNQIYNVGSTKENYQMKDIGKILESQFEDANLEYVEGVKDKRSYKVSFKKIANELGFKNEFTVENGIKEVKAAIQTGKIKNPNDKKYRNYNP